MSVLEIRVAREFDVVAIKLTTEAKERVAKCEAQNLCMGCLEPLFSRAVERSQRGCHKSCCKAFYDAINNGDLDEDDDLVTNQSLIKKGKWLPATKGGRRKKCKATAGFKKSQRVKS